MKISILDGAREDLVNGFRFYELQQVGLGSYFLDALYSDIESLMIYAGLHIVIEGGYYRLLSKRFPFAIYYRMNDSFVKVYAVLDCRRNPSWNRTRASRV